MGSVELLREARAAHLTVTLAGDGLHVEGPRSAGEIVGRIKAHKAEVMQALASEGICSQCGTRPGDAGEDANGDRWCVICRDVDSQLHALDVPAKLAGLGVRAAWVGALSELGELLGHPALNFKPGHSVTVGAAGWGKFSARASVEDMALVLARLRVLVDELPCPEGGAL
jgi:hypothetical protein